jgi:hypothetical protein
LLSNIKTWGHWYMKLHSSGTFWELIMLIIDIVKCWKES